MQREREEISSGHIVYQDEVVRLNPDCSKRHEQQRSSALSIDLRYSNALDARGVARCLEGTLAWLITVIYVELV